MVFSLAVAVGCAVLLYYQMLGIYDNKTLIEEWIVEKAEDLRAEASGKTLEAFTYPYDLGKKLNTALVLGPTWKDWMNPFGTPLHMHPRMMRSPSSETGQSIYHSLIWSLGKCDGIVNEEWAKEAICDNRRNVSLNVLGCDVDGSSTLQADDFTHLALSGKECNLIKSIKANDTVRCGRGPGKKIERIPFMDGMTWPLINSECDQYTLTREQLRQKKDKRMRLKPFIAFIPSRGCKYCLVDQCCAPCCYWHYSKSKTNASQVLSVCTGCWGCCKSPYQIDCMEENFLTLQPGEEVLVSRFRSHWLYGERKSYSDVAGIDSLPPSKRKERGDRGWFPRYCVYRKVHNE